MRNIQSNSLLSGPNIRVEFECNQTIIKSDEVIKDVARCPNFSRPVLERKILVSYTRGKHRTRVVFYWDQLFLVDGLVWFFHVLMRKTVFG